MSTRAARIPAWRTPMSFVLVWSAVAVGLTAGVIWIRLQSEGFATDFLRIAAGTFGGMGVGALATRSLATSRMAADVPLTESGPLEPRR